MRFRLHSVLHKLFISYIYFQNTRTNNSSSVGNVARGIILCYKDGRQGEGGRKVAFDF
jgi:hypothetical protein